MSDEKTPSPFNADNHVANHAKPRHRGPSLEEGNLTARRVAYDRIRDSEVKAGMHKPGSTNRHKP
jgi:hypothetical protein